MHELSIAEELVRVIRAEIRAYPNALLKSARVRVGTLRLIEPAILECCFEAAIWDSPLTGARLHIEQVAASARCRTCGLEFALEDRWFECPQCDTIGAELLCGDELQLVNLEIVQETAGAITDVRSPIEEVIQHG